MNADAVITASERTGTVGNSASASGREVEARAGTLVRAQSDWLRPLRTDWPTAALHRLARDSAVVRILIAGVRGSAPREPGACMLVARDGIEGTIGGGNLEWRAIEAAKTLLATRSASPAARTHRLVLGPELAQCCGGAVELWMERFTRLDIPLLRRAAQAANSGAPSALEVSLTPKGITRAVRVLLRDDGTGIGAGRVSLVSSDDSHTLVERIDVAHTPVWLYGAGHVGQALVRTLSELPFHITWVDSRRELFPSTLSGNVDTLVSTAPVDAALGAPRAAHHIVMTHDHALDYELCKALLTRNEFAWLGLIGSESKGARFRSRLKRDGVPPAQIARLVCPIGLTNISSKLPAAIAVGIAAQLLGEARPPDSAPVARDADDCSGGDCASCNRPPR